MNVQISEGELEIVKHIFRQRLPSHAKVWVFGSRVKGTSKKYADLDLAIDFIGEVIPFEALANLMDDFEASALPYKVDVVDLNAVSIDFRHIIESQREPILFT
jgi:predicted nucleotidyltransferase